METKPDIKALAIDLDGTLLDGEDLSPRNRDALKAANAKGLSIIIATARWRQLAQRISAEAELTGFPIIACSGAQVYDTVTGTDIFETRLPGDFVDRLYQICNDNRCIASATVDAHTWLKIDKKPAPEFLSEEMRWVAQLDDTSELPRIATVQGSETIAKVRQMHSEGYLDTVNVIDSVGPSGRIVVTITAKGADKGTALTKACSHLGLQTHEVIAFGDADNDLAMFALAGQSVAMGQAEDSVKAKATFVTAANFEDGVAAFIEQQLL